MPVPYKMKNKLGDIYVFADYENGFPIYRCQGGRTVMSDNDFRSLEIIEKTAPKLKCKLLGEDGNIFNLMALVAETMKSSPYWRHFVSEMMANVRASGDYYKALGVLSEYVIII